ncbi:MAG: bifunctional phosphoribosylaminoimidazolecarboxamide formyltransferase/IMP cyclohydrolase [Anaerolineae bacterium]|nr:bifunctional phosphoribosylaminoimidazolecarboxamide formyltransferase/IMP cyclohydrolase [Anaerolineae bacterium]
MSIQRALLSVSDKTGLVEFARGLADWGVELISTGGTAHTLRQAGLAVRTVEEVTGFPEILDGRVKTLHPAIHGGILARREPAHLAELAAHAIGPLDLVAVNLYPFAQTVARPEVTLAEAVEQIDIGGVALLRAAAKNFAAVTVLCDPADYPPVLAELRRRGDVSLATRQRLALKAFRHTAGYDAAIADYLAGQFPEASAEASHRRASEPFPAELHLHLWRVQALRYGENPHQQAALYGLAPEATPLGGRLLQGKPLSYNNLLDLDAAWHAVGDFSAPTVVIVKHNNPCGVACAETLAGAFSLALAGDPLSAFGGVIAVNRPFDETVAEALDNLFVEAIAAPGFTAGARQELAQRPGCRLLEMGDVETGLAPAPEWELRSVRQGILLQEPDTPGDEEWRVVSARQPTAGERESLAFAWRVVRHVRSNAIVLARGQATVGIGAGQMSRVDAVRLAVLKAGERARGAVLASDAFFPFPDGVEEAARAGVTAVVQPGGSVRDEEVIAAADAAGLAMLFTGRRHFRH